MVPFLKWAGGKRWLVPKFKDSIPTFSTYFEPFVGGGSLFFALEPRSAVLADVNPDLMNCYRAVRNRCSAVISVLRPLRWGEKEYYRTREMYVVEKDPVKRAAYFIYLNRTCWNGLYRENRQGHFNVPMRERSYRGAIFDETQLRQASRLLSRARLMCGDFEQTVVGARKGAFVYFDPPYITTHQNNGFIKYNAKLFGAADESRLAQFAIALANRNVHVAISNAAHPWIKELYDGPFHKVEIMRQSRIAADPAHRRAFSELIISTFRLSSTVSLGRS